MAQLKVPKGAINDLVNDALSADVKSSKEQAFFSMKSIREFMVSQDVCSITEVSKLLGMSRNRVLYLSTIRGNPLPIRRFPDGGGGSFVLRNELIEWLRNCPLESQRKPPSFRKLFRQFARMLICLFRVLFRIGRICELVTIFLKTYL